MNEILLFFKDNSSLIAICAVSATFIFGFITARHNRQSRELQLKLNVFINLAENIELALYELKHPIYVPIGEDLEVPVEFFKSLSKVKIVLSINSLEVVKKWENSYINTYFEILKRGYEIVDIKSEISAYEPIINKFENELIYLQHKYYDYFIKGDMDSAKRANEQIQVVNNFKKEYVEKRVDLISKRSTLENEANLKLFEMKGGMAKINMELFNIFRSELGLKRVKFNKVEHDAAINEWEDKLKDLIKIGDEKL